MKKNTTEVFANAPVPKAVFSNIIPSIISMIMVLVYNLADTFFIGQTKNALMVAGVSIATPLFLLSMAIGMLFGIGGTSMIARLLGAGNEHRAKNVSSFCFWTGLGIGLIFAVIMFTNANAIVRMIGAGDEVAGYAAEYLRIVSLCMPLVIFSNVFGNVIRAEGNAHKAMMGTIVGNIANVILDPIMILAMGMGVAGAAWATVLGNIMSSAIYLEYILRKSEKLSISIHDYRIKDGVAAGVFAIGVPACLNSILMSISSVICNGYVAAYGDLAIAGLGVAMKINMIVVMLLIGLGAGVQPILGFCFGARNRKRYLEVLRFSTMLAIGLSFIMTIICYLGAGPLATLFLDNADAYQYGMGFSRILIYSGPILGILFILINAIQSLGAGIPALVLNICRQGILYIPILTIFNKIFDTPRMLVMAQPVTDYASILLALVLFIYSYKRYFPKTEAELQAE